VSTDSGGIATSSTLSANDQVGVYLVSASASGAGSVNFNLENFEYLTWYVATTGSDSNDCETTSTPCLTINGAIGKAGAGDTVMVEEGTYTGTGDQVVLVDKDINLSGGWDSGFSTQSGTTVIDGEYTRRGMTVNASVTAEMELFTIQNCDDTILSGSSGIRNEGTLTLEKVTIQNNGTVETRNGVVHNSSTGVLTISNSAVINNGSSDWCFGGVYNNSSGVLTVINSTISNNISNYIYCYPTALVGYGTVTLRNATIVENTGADIMGAFGTFTLQNSMIGWCDNTTSMTSLGYNIISANNCPVTPTDGDQFGTPSEPINLFIGPLQDNGGATYTQALLNAPPYFVSPAIDAGSPTTPGSGGDACELTDQRGVTRPLDGDSDTTAQCDIGAYEYDPGADPPPTTWFVSTTGSDSNDCESTSTPCATINGVLSKGGISFGDSIKITGGTFTGSGDEVVFIDRDIYLSGGWDSSFSTQNDLTIIDGENTRRGIKVDESINAAIELFQVENGFNEETSGPYTGRGGGIFNDGYLILQESTIRSNTSLGVGGGIYNSDTLMLYESTVSGNYADSYGGGIWSSGVVELENSTISGNASIEASGGGIANYDQGTVTINNATVAWNYADSHGGGIHAGTFTAKNSIIANNNATTAPDCYSTITSEGYNLVGDNSDCSFTATTGDQVGTGASPIDPELSPLQDNGGPTFTLALMTGSPAIDAGNPATPGSGGDACLGADQRGTTRPDGTHCDIGAFEGSVPWVQLAPVNTYTANNTSSLPGSFLCNQSQPDCTDGSNTHADAGHQYAIGTYYTYLTKHTRDSIDDDGMTIVSTVQYCDPGESCPYDNAYWDGSQLVYGSAHDWPLADDVVAHEFTHGVTEHTSSLYYYYQSGAISESLSDLWGEYYDQVNGLGDDTPGVKWLAGEDVTGFGPFRSMSDPSAHPYYDPDKMTSPYYHLGDLEDMSDEDFDFDYGGVHTNSGVNNKAVYLMVDGDSFNGYTVSGIGWDKVLAIYYEVQTSLLTSGSDYGDLYYAVQQACSNLV
jgi:hypothetical protein